MNLADIREAIKSKTGYPERGTTGTIRLNRLINHALRQVRGDMPEVLLREEYRFELSKPISESTRANGTILGLHPSGAIAGETADPQTWVLGPFTAADTVLMGLFDPGATQGVYRGRWLDVERDGKVWTLRVHDIYLKVTDSYPDNLYNWNIVVDKPWDNTTDLAIPYKLYTYEYPYPGDVVRVRQVIIDPDGRRSTMRFSTLPESLASFKIQNGWKATGTPQISARGDFFQLEPPHYTPEIELDTTPAGDPVGSYTGPTNYYAWGHSGTGTTQTEQPTYGVAGTFSYRVVHVWGRHWPLLNNVTEKRTFYPWYYSAPSPPTAQISTGWGGPAVKLTTPDIEYVYGYGQDSTLPSYHRNGYEKWIYRARHDIDKTTTNPAMSGSNYPEVEKDGVYYLWKITEGDVTVTRDRGDQDPVERLETIRESHGHYHIRFDYLPNDINDVLMSVIRRPETLTYDTDAPRIPPEAMDALIHLTCSYILGERDGSADRVAMYRALYNDDLRRLRSLAALDSHVRPSFSDGLSPTGQPAIIPGDVTGW